MVVVAVLDAMKKTGPEGTDPGQEGAAGSRAMQHKKPQQAATQSPCPAAIQGPKTSLPQQHAPAPKPHSQGLHPTTAAAWRAVGHH